MTSACLAVLVLFGAFPFTLGQGTADEVDIVQVSPPSGPVLGRRIVPDGNGTSYAAFRGIPYAEPPTGTNRFQDPRPKISWAEPRSALQFGSICAQPNAVFGVLGAEDCLFLNIYTPLPNPQSNASLLPVMVFVPGGGFIVGSSNAFEGDLFMNSDVIYVSLNYRLGVLGFTTLGTAEVSGNYGLKDQQEALRWIQMNIGSFGGDPGRVTLSGYSAGGMSVHALQMSPLSVGLFHAVIPMSGSALYRVYGNFLGEAEAQGDQFLELVGCSTSANHLGCLQNLTLTEVVGPVQEFPNFKEEYASALEGNHVFIFGPNRDSYATYPCLPDLTYNTLKTGSHMDVPILTGVVANEGGFFASSAWDDLGEYNANFTEYHGPSWMFRNSLPNMTEEQSNCAEIVKYFYNGGKDFSQDNDQGLLDFLSDGVFVSNGIKGAQLQSQSQSSPVYFYQTTRPSSATVQPPGQDWGIVHIDDLYYFHPTVFGQTGLVTEDDKTTSRKMIKLWTNFAKYHNPTPWPDPDFPEFWEEYTAEDGKYMDIQLVPTMKTFLHRARVNFWEKIYWDDIGELIEAAAMQQA